jgi:hypothetical protein
MSLIVGIFLLCALQEMNVFYQIGAVRPVCLQGSRCLFQDWDGGILDTLRQCVLSSQHETEASRITIGFILHPSRKKELSERWHSCECGTELDRDANATINILERGRRQQGAISVEVPCL